MPKREHLERPMPLSQVLEGLIRPADWQALKERQRVRAAWEQVVPEALRQQARLVDLRRRVLWVEVTTSSWLQELQFLKPLILKELEKILGPDLIRDLQAKVG
jgi:predicted nucleic acid-binding Zn ribbon protein